MEREKSLFQPLFEFGANFKPVSLENNLGYKIIVPDEIWTVENVITKEEAELMIESSEKAGFIDAEFLSETGQVLLLKDIRDSRRVLIKDELLSEYLFKRCVNSVPRAFEGGLLVGMNEKIRFLKYDKPGNHFLPHEDGAQERNELERSTITFQIYLSEGMEGGETGFIDNCFPDGRYECVPKTGKAVFFRQAGWIHEGTPIKSGIKYTLLTDFMYKWFTKTEAEVFVKEGKEISKCGVCGVIPQFVTTNCKHEFLVCNCSPYNSLHALKDGGEKIDQKQSYCSICNEKFKFPEEVRVALQKKFFERKIVDSKIMSVKTDESFKTNNCILL